MLKQQHLECLSEMLATTRSEHKASCRPKKKHHRGCYLQEKGRNSVKSEQKRCLKVLKSGQVSPLQKELIQEAVKHLKVHIKLTTESQPS